MHNCRSTRQQRLQKVEITRNRSDDESLSFHSITKIAAIHNPHTTQKMTDRKQVVCRVVDHNYSNVCMTSNIYRFLMRSSDDHEDKVRYWLIDIAGQGLAIPDNFMVCTVKRRYIDGYQKFEILLFNYLK